MRTDNIWNSVQPHKWKWRTRTQPIRAILIHATRSGEASYTTGREYRATINWFVSPDNVQGGVAVGETWSSMASRIVGDGGAMCIVMPDDKYPAYSAGHADPIAKSYELTQPTRDSRFDSRDLDRLAMEVAVDCKIYNIPPRHIVFLSGDNHEAPGIAFHDASANGKKYGKSDPGPLFDRDGFCRQVAAYMEEEDVTERVWDGSRTWIVGKGGASLIEFPAMDKPLEAIYGPHTRVMSPAELEKIRVK